MKYCFVTPDFYPRIGGGENYVRFLARELSKNHTIYVLCPNDLEKGVIAKDNVITIYSNFFRILGNKFVKPWIMYRWIKILRPDIIYVSGPGVGDILAVCFAKTFRAKCVLTYHADLDMSKVTSRLFIWFFFRTVINHFDAIIVQSQLYANCLLSRKVGSQKLFLVPPGVNYDKPKEEYPHQKVSKELIFVGALDKNHPYKHLEVLLEAMQSLPEFHLTVVGDGNLRSAYEFQAKSLLSVTFVGQITSQELTSLYDTSSILILPSNSPEEGFGVVLVEAVSRCCRVITGSNAGGSEFIRSIGVLGELFDGSAEDLVIKIKLLNSRVISNRHWDATKNILQEFRWDNVATQIGQICEHLLSQISG